MTTPLLHYEIHGRSGPCILLVHGMLSSRAQWMYNLEALSEFGRPVVIELLGHGRSPCPDDAERYSPRHYVEEFEAIREAVGADRWFIIGQSLGAALTLRYALDHPNRVIAQVFTNSNSALAGEGWSERVLPAMAAQAKALRDVGRAALENHPLNPARGKRLPADARAALVADYARADPLGVALTGLHTVPDSSVRSRAHETRAPTMLTVGEREKGFEEARRFAEEAIPGIEVVGLDAGHAVNLEAAEGWNQAVSEFFRRWIDREQTIHDF